MRYFAIVFALFLSLSGASAQIDTNGGRGSSYEGRYFLLGFMQNELSVNALTQKVYLCSRNAASVTVNIPTTPISTQTYNLPANSIQEVTIPNSVEVRTAETPIKKSIEIISNEVIAVYAFSSQTKSSDGYSTIPMAFWGKEYYVMSLGCDLYQANPGTRPGEFMIIAGQDGTQIEYTPTVPTSGGKAAGFKQTITLNKGDCYLVKAADAARGKNDISGTYIKATKPIGVLSGHVRTAIPQTYAYPSGGTDSKDHIIEMLPPSTAWGFRYASSPFGVGTAGDMFRVMAKDPNTTVTLKSATKNQTITLAKSGDVFEVNDMKEPALWTADKPVLLTQFMYTGYYGDKILQDQDPCFVVLPPIEQFVNRIIFRAPGTQNANQYSNHFVNLICEEASLTTLKLNNQLITTLAPAVNSQLVPNTTLHWVKVRVTPGIAYTLTSLDRFSGIIFGHGDHDSYGIPLGASLVDPEKKDTIPPIFHVQDSCGGQLRGVVTDSGAGNLGLASVDVVESETINYTLYLKPFADGDTLVWFTARVNDLLAPGRFTIIAVDRYGNKTIYRYYYTPPKFTVSTQINFPGLKKSDTTCKEWTLINQGDSVLVIENVWITGDSRIQLRNLPPLPDSLKSGDTLRALVCYVANGDTTDFTAQVNIALPCDMKIPIDVLGTLGRPSYYASGTDIGDVRVGEKGPCRDIVIHNTGNTTLRVDSLQCDNCSPAINLQTKGILPILIPPDSTVIIKVCFDPDSAKKYDVPIRIYTREGITDTIHITGRGIAPNIEITSIDWWRRRVGTKNDSLLILRNTGNARAEISLEEFTGDTTSFLHQFSKSFPRVLFPGESISFPQLAVSFVPKEARALESWIKLSVDWQQHKPVVAHLQGVGTLPVIETIDIDFGTVTVGKFKDSIAKIFHTSGNEDLTVDAMKLTGTNTASFIVNPNDLSAKKIGINSDFSLPIRFSPDKAGAFEAFIDITHDAEPNYARRTSRVRLTGLAKDPPPAKIDTVLAKITLQIAGGAVFACQPIPASAEIRNTGNVPITIDSIAWTTVNADIVWMESPKGIRIDSGFARTFAFSVIPKSAGAVSISVTLYYNSGHSENVKANFTANVASMAIAAIDKQTSTPGEILPYKLKGVISGGDSLRFAFSARLTYDASTYKTAADTSSLRVLSGGLLKTIPLTMTSSSGQAELKAQEITVSLPIEWEFSVPFNVYLSSVRNGGITASVSGNNCVVGSTRTAEIELGGVCAYDLRVIQEGNFLWMMTYPNPATEEAVVEFNLPSDNVVSLSVMNLLGQSFSLVEKLFLKKGKHSYKLQGNQLNSGIYTVILQTTERYQQQYLIINK